ncbi:hypothetical protein BH11ACT2_BH11ACT2_02490 [soil metagenome]
MTMIENAATAAHLAAAPPEPNDRPNGLAWENVEGVEPAVWVGRVRGIFVGMVEARWQEGFTATTRLGRKLGTFGTLEDAQRSFVVTTPGRNR